MSNGGLPAVEIDQGKHTMDEPLNADKVLSKFFAEAGYYGDSFPKERPIKVNMGTKVRGGGRSPVIHVSKETDKGSIEIHVKSDGTNESRRAYFLFPQPGIQPVGLFQRLKDAEKRLQGEMPGRKNATFVRTVFKKYPELLAITVTAIQQLYGDDKTELPLNTITKELSKLKVQYPHLISQERYIFKYLEKIGVIHHSGPRQLVMLLDKEVREIPKRKDPSEKAAKIKKVAIPKELIEALETMSPEECTTLHMGYIKLKEDSTRYDEVVAQIESLFQQIQHLETIKTQLQERKDRFISLQQCLTGH